MVSVDIREASFQALRFIDPNLVDQCPTWPDYLSKSRKSLPSCLRARTSGTC
jgi:hypothetical protein